MSTPPKVCLVTGELYPFSGGGIGRLIHNVLRDSLRRVAPVELHVLVPASFDLSTEAVAAYYGEKVVLHRARPLDGTGPDIGFDGVYPPPWALSATPWHGESMAFMHRLKAMAAEGLTFDVVEFPDYHGWAFCALQEKKLGRAFSHTEIAVRIHATAGIIEHFERRHLSLPQIGGFELERKALLDADRVVAPLRPTAELHQRFYGFPDAWLTAVTLEFPPVVEPLPGFPAAAPAGPRPLVFGSKIQPIKRPDLFIKGAALFMKRCPEFDGTAVFATQPVAPQYLRETRSLIPTELSARFAFLDASAAERDQLLATGVAVVSSDYESLNLLAYEVSAVGGHPVLNATCPAFGDGTPFVDERNCHKFDGTVHGLARALERAWKSPGIEKVEWRADAPYWEHARARPEARPKLERQPLVSVIVTNYNLGLHLPETLASIAASSYSNVETILVDDASTEALDLKLLEAIERDAAKRPSHLTLLRNPVNLGLAASRNLGIRAAAGDFVLPLDADDVIGPHFLEQAARALESNPAFDVVVPTAAYFEKDEDIPEQRFCDYATFLGDVPSMGLVENRFSCATSLMRRTLFERFSYNESLSSYEDWDLYLRLALNGGRFLVTNDINFFYRRREGSMVKSVTAERRAQLMARIYEGLPRPLPPSAHLFGFALPLRGSQPSNGTLARGLRHDLVDGANAALKRLPAVHRLLKRTVELTTPGAGPPDVEQRPLRHELADSVNRAFDRIPRVKSVLRRVLSSPARS